MYGQVAGGTIATGGGALALTGLNTMWTLVLGVTLVVAGLAVTRSTLPRPHWMPRRRRVRG